MANCDYCHQTIPAKVHPYTLRIELFPAVEPSLEITAGDLEVDFAAEMDRLVKIMESMDDAEIIRQEKLVYVAHRFTLCPACRDRLARQLERLSPPPM